jgi:hypothetical protein
MSRNSRSLRFVLFTTFATCALCACGDRASGQAGAAGSAGKPGRSAPSSCPSVEQVGQAAGFQVTLKQSIVLDTWMGCSYEMTGRYRGAGFVLTGEPASKADSVYAYVKQRVKEINGAEAEADRIEADRIDVGSGGWAFGADSKGEAAAVIGSHVYNVEFSDVALLRSLGDQKDAMVRVLKSMAH